MDFLFENGFGAKEYILLSINKKASRKMKDWQLQDAINFCKKLQIRSLGISDFICRTVPGARFKTNGHYQKAADVMQYCIRIGNRRAMTDIKKHGIRSWYAWHEKAGNIRRPFFR